MHLSPLEILGQAEFGVGIVPERTSERASLGKAIGEGYSFLSGIVLLNT